MAEPTPAQPWPYRDSDRHGWPDTEADPDCKANAGEVCKAKLEVRIKRTEQEIARAAAQEAAETAVAAEYYKSVFEVAKGAIDRSRSSADTVQKAAAAIVTLYTGVLALAFSVADNPLPGKALFAAILLGVAILFSTAFLAFLPGAEPRRETEASTPPPEDQSVGERLANMFILWTRRAALARGRLLRASVVALAGAVALMPAPFVTISPAEVAKPDIAWPEPSTNAKGNIELEKIVYAAQVAEVAEQRKQPLAAEGEEWVWTAACGLALLLTLGTLCFPLPRLRICN